MFTMIITDSCPSKTDSCSAFVISLESHGSNVYFSYVQNEFDLHSVLQSFGIIFIAVHIFISGCYGVSGTPRPDTSERQGIHDHVLDHRRGC